MGCSHPLPRPQLTSTRGCTTSPGRTPPAAQPLGTAHDPAGFQGLPAPRECGLCPALTCPIAQSLILSRAPSLHGTMDPSLARHQSLHQLPLLAACPLGGDEADGAGAAPATRDRLHGSRRPPDPPRHGRSQPRAVRGFHSTWEATGRGRHKAAWERSYCWDSQLEECRGDKIKPARDPHVAAGPAFIT